MSVEKYLLGPEAWPINQSVVPGHETVRDEPAGNIVDRARTAISGLFSRVHDIANPFTSDSPRAIVSSGDWPEQICGSTTLEDAIVVPGAMKNQNRPHA